MVAAASFSIPTIKYNGVATGEAASKGRDVMMKKVQEGLAGAGRLIKHVEENVPQDAIVPGRLLNFENITDVTASSSTGAQVNQHGLRVVWHDAKTGTDVEQRIHRHALGQLAGKAGLPAGFISELEASPEAWRKDLAAEILNKHFHERRSDRAEDAAGKRFLVRSINGQARGFLSDKYRRIDSRPTLGAFVEECQNVGAVPYEGIVSDVRVSLRALLPVVFEPIPGEVLCFGAEWGNSDFGAAKHWMRVFMLRLWCLNGATMDDVLAQVHSGGRLGETIEYSQRTMDLDTRANVSALRDVVRSSLGPAQIDANIALIKQASEQKVEWKNKAGSLVQRLTKGEQKLVKDAFESQDVVNLPAGKSTYRLSNALSWVANHEDVAPERRIELQREAGAMLTGKRDAAVSDEG